MNKLSIIILTLALVLTVRPAPARENKKPFRIGIAGLTHTHVHWILGRAKDGDFEITGIAEANRALAGRYLKQYNLPLSLLYSSLDEMLDKTKPEAVAAFNSTYEHLEVVKACATRNIHVMVEKPLAVSLEHAQQIQGLAAKHHIYVLTNYETTWYGSNLNIHETFRVSHPFGKVRKVVVHDGHQGPKEIGVNEEFLSWLTDPVRNGGGALMDFGCYGANLITWLMNGQKPQSVLAITQQLKPNIYPHVDDEATIVLVYPEAQGIIQASWNWPYNRKDMEVYGESGYIIADRQGAKIKSAPDKPEEFVKAPTLEKPFHDPFAYFAAVVRGEVNVHAADFSSLENNMIVMEILEAAKKSAREGRVVYLNSK